jgi:hypothetical protein
MVSDAERLAAKATVGEACLGCPVTGSEIVSTVDKEVGDTLFGWPGDISDTPGDGDTAAGVEEPQAERKIINGKRSLFIGYVYLIFLGNHLIFAVDF